MARPWVGRLGPWAGDGRVAARWRRGDSDRGFELRLHFLLRPCTPICGRFGRDHAWLACLSCLLIRRCKSRA